MAFDADLQKAGFRACGLALSLILIPSAQSFSQVEGAPAALAVVDTVIAQSTTPLHGDSLTTVLPEPTDSLTPAADSLGKTGADSLQTAAPALEDSIMKAFLEEEESVYYSGDTIETIPSENIVNISGKAVLKYKDANLGAEEITYDMKKERLHAEKDTYLKDKSGEITGQEMDYSLKEEKGVISDAETQHDAWYFKGEKISKVGDEDLYGKNSSFTTCDLEEPHYHFKCQKLKLTINDKVIARPIVFYVRDIPFFVFPFYIFPIESGRKSGLLKPNFGLFSGDQRGRSITNLGYFWAASDYYDLTVATDLYERLRWTIWGEGRYKKRYTYDGNVYASYTRDSARGDRRRGELRMLHNQTLSKKSSFRADVNIATDRNIYKDLSYDINQVLQRSLKSRVTYNHMEKWGSYYLTFDSDYSLDRDQTVIQAPIFSLTKNSTSLFKAAPGQQPPRLYGNLVYSASGDFASKYITRKQATLSDSSKVTTKLQTSTMNATLTDPMQFFGWLNLSPGFSYREVLFNSDEEGVGFINQGTYTANATVFTRLYGIFEGPKVGPITKWRHTISPQVRYSYSPERQSAGSENSQFFQGLSSPGTNIVYLTLTNDLDAKYVTGEGEKMQMKSLTLLEFITQTSYNIKAAREGKPGWGNLSSRLESNPGDRFKFSLEATHSLYDNTHFDPFLTNLTTNFTLKGKSTGREEGEGSQELEGTTESEYLGQSPYGDQTGITGYSPRMNMALKGPWSFTITHNLSKSRTSKVARQSLRNTLSFNPSHKWRLLYSYQYDLTNGDLQDQSLTLNRDLHRWEMYISLRQLPENRFSYEFRVDLKDIPALEVRRAAQTP